MSKLRKTVALFLAVVLILSALGNSTISVMAQGTATTGKLPDQYVDANGSAVIRGGYAASDRYVVLSAQLKALDGMSDDWYNSVVVGVSGATPYANYAFQLVYAGDGSGLNGVKLNGSSYGAGTFEGIDISTSQPVNRPEFETLFTTGLSVKIVRMNNWAYLFADMGKGYEQVAILYLPKNADTMFTLYTAGTRAQMTSVTVQTGKTAVAAALNGVSFAIDDVSDRILSIDEQYWSLDAKLDYDRKTPVFADNYVTNYNADPVLGEAYSIKTSNTQGWNILWSLDGTNWTYQQPYFTNPGTYTIYYKCEAVGDFPEISGSKQLTIRYYLSELQSPTEVKTTYLTVGDVAGQSSGVERLGSNSDGTSYYLAWLPQWTKPASLKFYAPLNMTKEQVKLLLDMGVNKLNFTITQSAMKDNPWWGLTNTISADWTSTTVTVSNNEGAKKVTFSLQDLYNNYDAIASGELSLLNFSISSFAANDGGVWDGKAWVSSSYEIRINNIEVESDATKPVENFSSLNDLSASTGIKLTYTDRNGKAGEISGASWFGQTSEGEYYFESKLPQWVKSGSLAFYAPLSISKSEIKKMIDGGAAQMRFSITQSGMLDSPWWGLRNTVSADWTNNSITVSSDQGIQELTFSLQDLYDHYDAINSGEMAMFKFSIGGLDAGDGGVWTGSAWVSSGYKIRIQNIVVVGSTPKETRQLTLTGDQTGNSVVFNTDSYSENETTGGYWLRWTRELDKLTMYISHDGKSYEEIQSVAADTAAGDIRLSLDGEKSVLQNLKLQIGKENVEKITPIGYQVKLGNSISVDFYVKFSDELIQDSGAYLHLADSDGGFINVPVTQARYDAATDSYAFTYEVAAAQMTSDISLQIVDGFGVTGKIYTYQIKNYAQTILQDDENIFDDRTKDMVRAMLNYGAAAQVYFGHNIDNLANSGLPDEERVLAEPVIGDAYNREVVGSVSGLSYYGSSMRHVSKLAIRHYFVLAENQSINNFAFLYNGQNLVPEEKDGLYYVEIADIYAMGLSQMYSLVVQKGEASLEIKYGPYTYIKSMLAKSGSDDNKNLVRALYTYSEVANTYAENVGLPYTKLEYSNEIPVGGIEDNGAYNSDLFYRNDNVGIMVPDVHVIYISDENSTEYGSYYMYGTYGVGGLQALKSTDLQNWTDMTPVRGLALEPAGKAERSWWAPEVIYDDGLYYMFYSAKENDSEMNSMYVAVAEEPYGPFEPLDEANTSWFDPQKANDALYTVITGIGKVKTWNCIDASPFIDTDGQKYVLFCRADDDGGNDNIWGVRMIDWATPDYSTLIRLTKTGYKTATGSQKMNYECSAYGYVNAGRNEAPYMYIRENSDGTVKYYLTMSIYGLPDYTVIQAVGDNPLGPFTKLEESEGGILIANDHLQWDHIQGPGHHCFLTIDDELFIYYHQQVTRNIDDGNNWNRFTSWDRIKFVENGNGQEVMVCNGPTWSLQPKIEKYAEYINIADESNVMVNGGSDVAALTDGVLSMYQNVSFVKEYSNTQAAIIELTFDEYREITALQIFNSKTISNAFQSVKRIEITYQNDLYPDGAVAYIDNLQFDWESYTNKTTGEIRPGGSAVAVFEPLTVKSIRIVIEVPAEQSCVNVSEIVVLGK